MISKLVLLSFFLNCVLCSVTHYKASVVDVSKSDVAITKYESLILEAAKSNVDLLVLNPTKVGSETSDSCVSDLDRHDAMVKTISKAAKAAGVYVIAQVYEKTRCQYRDEGLFNIMVFDRDGGVVAATPASTPSCNSSESKIIKFTTDFGVTFALVTEEDIILHGIEYFEGIRNFIVSRLTSNIPYSFVKQFISSWSFVNKANVVSPGGLYGANVDTLENLIVAELQKSGGSPSLISTSSPYDDSHSLHHSTKTLNTAASSRGYLDTVCDGSFCCNFYVKTSDIASPARYSLWVREDVLHLTLQRVTLHMCGVSSQMPADIKFDKITITPNFTRDSVLLPSVSTTKQTDVHNIKIQNDSIELIYTNVLTFSVLSRDYNKDNIIELQNETNIDNEYISYENVNDFFDYVWIRVRVLIFIVSVYVLEML